MGSITILTLVLLIQEHGIYFHLFLNNLQFPLLMFYNSQHISLLPLWSGVFLSILFFFKKYLLIYLAVLALSCSMWHLVPWPGIKPGPPALGAQSLHGWTTREVLVLYCFWGNVNWIVSLIYFSYSSLLVHRNATHFYILILHPANLVNSLMSSPSFLMSLGFSKYSIMPFANSEILLIPLQFGFFSFLFLSDCNRHPILCLIKGVRVEIFVLFLI